MLYIITIVLWHEKEITVTTIAVPSLKYNCFFFKFQDSEMDHDNETFNV